MAHLDSLKGSDDIMGFVQQLVNTKAKPQAEVAPKPAEAPPAETPEPAAEPEPVADPVETPPEGTPPAEEPAADPAADPEPAPGAEVDDDGTTALAEDAITPITAARARLALKTDDQVGRLATRFMQRNKDMTMVEAVTAAQKQLGVNQPAPAAAQPAKPAVQLPSIADIDAEIAQLTATRKTAAANLELENYDKATEAIEALKERKGLVIAQQQQQQRDAVKSYNAGFAASEAKAAELYEFANKPESPGGKLMLEIDEALEKNGDPLFNSPDKPLRLAQMAATRLNIPPKTKLPAKTAKPALPAAPAAPGAKKDVLASGASRTTPHTGPVLNPLDKKIQENARNPAELDKALAALGIGT